MSIAILLTHYINQILDVIGALIRVADLEVDRRRIIILEHYIQLRRVEVPLCAFATLIDLLSGTKAPNSAVPFVIAHSMYRA